MCVWLLWGLFAKQSKSFQIAATKREGGGKGFSLKVGGGCLLCNICYYVQFDANVAQIFYKKMSLGKCI